MSRSFLFILFLIPGLMQGQIKLDGILDAGMVLQRETEHYLSGKAQTGSKIYIEFDEFIDSAAIAGDGSWELTIPPHAAGGPYTMRLKAGGDSLVLEDVYIGDVWLASGQSNMDLQLEQSLNGSLEIAASDNPLLRQYLVKNSLSNTPREESPAGSAWIPSHPDHAGEFSAVAYYFGKALQEELDIPIGILKASYGGSRIESWMSEDVLGYDEGDISLGENSFNQATVCYNAMIHPIRNYPIKGVIWYQGESNMGSRETALMYQGQLTKLIAFWRTLWRNEELPFIWVQLPNIGNEASESSPGTWDALPMLRAAMSRVRSVPHTAEAIAIDLGEVDIHPLNKEPVGQRLSLLARQLVYGEEDLPAESPRYLRHRLLDGGRVEVFFDNTGDGLVLQEGSGDEVRWFALAGQDEKFYQAEAELSDSSVIVSNPGISNPRFIRYAWEHNPPGVNLYNSYGLPAAPFKVEVNDPGFTKDFFRALDYVLDRGESTVLTWAWKGADSLWLNGEAVDTIGGIRMWPGMDSTFTLLARERSPEQGLDSAILQIRVIQPDPVVEILCHAGPWICPGDTVPITAGAHVPAGGQLKGLEYYVNGIRADSSGSSNLDAIWIPERAGLFEIFARGISDGNTTGYSDTLYFRADHFNSILLEAEEASIKGGKWIGEDAAASMGSFVELTRDWILDFGDIEMDSAQLCQLEFSFMHDSYTPRQQHLDINGEGPGNYLFASYAPDTWTSQYLSWPLDSGLNAVKLTADWGYMKLDFLRILYLPSSRPDTLDTRNTQKETGRLQLWPNPVQDELHILPGESMGELKLLTIIDLSGTTRLNYSLEGQTRNSSSIPVDLSKLPTGSYIIIVEGSRAVSHAQIVKL